MYIVVPSVLLFHILSGCKSSVNVWKNVLDIATYSFLAVANEPNDWF